MRIFPSEEESIISENNIPSRYSAIASKLPREIVMLQGRGCFWRRCTFCDYHADAEPDNDAAFKENEPALSRVDGRFKRLEVINSGSLFELSDRTLSLIRDVCRRRGITDLHCECHYARRDTLDDMRRFFGGIALHPKTGVETFDIDFRENTLDKGLGDATPEEIREHFEDCCLLVGIKGQTKAMLTRDIVTALSLFERVCVNIFTPNSTRTKRDDELIRWYLSEYGKALRISSRVDLLIENSDFGVYGINE